MARSLPPATRSWVRDSKPVPAPTWPDIWRSDSRQPLSDDGFIATGMSVVGIGITVKGHGFSRAAKLPTPMKPPAQSHSTSAYAGLTPLCPRQAEGNVPSVPEFFEIRDRKIHT